MKNNKKVYCKNCKYCKYIITHEPITNGGEYLCHAELNTPFTPKLRCENKNKERNCRDYKRKWWKIWVKK